MNRLMVDMIFSFHEQHEAERAGYNVTGCGPARPRQRPATRLRKPEERSTVNLGARHPADLQSAGSPSDSSNTHSRRLPWDRQTQTIHLLRVNQTNWRCRTARLG